MQSSYENSINERKAKLEAYLKDSMMHVAENGIEAWDDRESLDNVLQSSLHSHPILGSCNLIYAIDPKGIQVSSQIYPDHIDGSFCQQDLSNRPYFKNELPEKGIRMSPIYVNRLDGHSCISVVKAVREKTTDGSDGKLLGYIIADFSLLSLPSDNKNTEDRRIWLQVKGDPSIRSTLFMQSRTQSLMDDVIDDAISTVEELMQFHGVFHAKLHFSSSRCTLWLYDDPYHYRVHTLDELNDSCLAYSVRPYPETAVVQSELIPNIFHEFKTLRFADDTVYLRAASLNIINGMVGLNFSCDGSHYIPAEEFLTKGEMFWLGNLS